MIFKISKKIFMFSVLAVVGCSNFSNSIFSQSDISLNLQQKLITKATPACWLYDNSFEIFNLKFSRNKIFFFSKDGSFHVDRYTWWDYSINQKSDNKYVQERVGGKIYQKFAEFLYLLPKDRKYKGNVLIDEYRAGYPMYWSFTSIKQFRSFAEFIKNKILESEIKSKPILLLEINNVNFPLEDISISDIFSSEEKAFLGKYFELPSSKDIPFVLEFFANSKSYLREVTSRVEVRPEYKYDTTREVLFHQVLRYAKDFKQEKLIPVLLDPSNLCKLEGLALIAAIYLFKQNKELHNKLTIVKDKARAIINI